MPGAPVKPGPRIRWYWRLLLSIGGALSAGVMAALVLIILDLYLTGHGHQSLNQPGVGGVGPMFSVSDVILLASILLAGLLVWFVLRGVTRPH